MELVPTAEFVFAAYGGLTVLRKVLPKGTPKDAIGRIYLSGQIHDYSPGLGSVKGIDPHYVEEQIKKAENKKVRGIIFEINSPGGSVSPSKEITEQIKDVEIPTVALVKDYAASGGYEIASACDRIIASPYSFVGSIGVLSPHMDFSKLAEQLGIRDATVYAGEFKNMGNPLKPLDEKERKILQDMVDELHEMFIAEIANNRDLDLNHVRGLANGLVYHGTKAKEFGLIDELGGLKEATDWIEKKEGFKYSDIIDFRPKHGIRDILGSISSSAGENFFQGMYKAALSQGYLKMK